MNFPEKLEIISWPDKQEREPERKG